MQPSSLTRRQTGKTIRAVTSFSVNRRAGGGGGGGGGRGGLVVGAGGGGKVRLAKLIYAFSRLSCTSFDLYIHGFKM